MNRAGKSSSPIPLVTKRSFASARSLDVQGSAPPSASGKRTPWGSVAEMRRHGPT